MLIPEYPLRTERLLLRPYREDDLDFVYDVQSRPEVARYLYQDVRDREQARESLRQKIAATELRGQGDNLTPLILRADTGEPVGDVLLAWTSQPHATGEIGYVIHPDHAGHGYATEAARLMVRLGFEELKLHRIVGRIDGRNAASARVLQHLGMRREAYFVQNEWVKGEWTDEAVYAILADEWWAGESRAVR